MSATQSGTSLAGLADHPHRHADNDDSSRNAHQKRTSRVDDVSDVGERGRNTGFDGSGLLRQNDSRHSTRCEDESPLFDTLTSFFKPFIRPMTQPREPTSYG